jgi:dihydroorotase
MTLLLKQVLISDSNSPANGSVKDIFIKDGKIEKIADKIDIQADQILDQKGLSVSLGWIDPFVHFCDPGFEHREDLLSGATAALQGGYTTVFVLPNTSPVIDNKSQVSYVLQKANQLPNHVVPIGALSKKIEGKDLAEMIDMHQNGAVAFSDGLHPIQSPLLFLKALQYVKTFDGVVIQMPIDKTLGSLGLMNEGIVSTQLGLPGIPSIAEELMIQRDIELLRYTKSKLHITGVSTKKGIELIASAKAEGLSLTCSVTPYHLTFTEEDLQTYDTLLKVNPPLRTKEDRQALITAVQNGVVDCISSHHLPQNWDAKTIEFEYAKSGMASIETAFAAVLTAIPSLTAHQISQLFSGNARKIFNTPLSITEGATAELTIFDMKGMTKMSKEQSASKSANNAFWNQSLQGKTIGTIVKGSLHTSN